MKLNKAAMATFLLTSTGLCAQAQVAYASEFSGQLYRIDMGRHQIQAVGNMGRLMFGLAISPNTGRLLGTNAEGNLYSINPNTAQSYIVGEPGKGPIDAMDCVSPADLPLWGSDEKDPANFINMDEFTAGPIKTTRPPQGPRRTEAVAYDHVTTGNFFFVSQGQNGEELWTSTFDRVNRDFLASKKVGELGTQFGYIAGIDFDDNGNLWALGVDGSANVLDPTNGQLHFQWNTGVAGWHDLSFGVVPEPSSTVMVSVAVLALVRSPKRRFQKNS